MYYIFYQTGRKAKYDSVCVCVDNIECINAQLASQLEKTVLNILCND